MKIFKDIKNNKGLNIIFGEYETLLPLFNNFEYVKSFQDIKYSKSNKLIIYLDDIFNTSDYRLIDTIVEDITKYLIKNNKLLIGLSERKQVPVFSHYTHSTLSLCNIFLDIYDEEIIVIKNRYGNVNPIKISNIKTLIRTKKLKRILN